MEQPNHPTEKHRRSSRRHSRSSNDITNDSPKKKVRKAKSSSSALKGTTDVANKSSSIMDCIENPRRKKAKKRLDSSKTHADDLEFVLQCVKGLIQLNQEIWGRCEDCCISKDQDRTAGIQMIRMHPLSVYFEENCSRNARVLLKFQRLIKSFDCIPELPKELEEMFPLPCNDGVFPDYDRYLENILLLDDGVLGAFLPRFQSYLESVQVFLGGIEDWCNEFIEARIFVEEMFDKDLSPGSLGLTENVEDFSRDGQLWYGEYITLLNLDDTKTMNVDFYLACQRDRKRLKAYLDFLKM